MTSSTAPSVLRPIRLGSACASLLGAVRLALCLCLGLSLAGPGARADDAAEIAAIGAALDLPSTFSVLQAEGAHYGEELATEILPDGATAAWRRDVDRIYDPVRIEPVFRDRFAKGLQGADLAAIRTFVESDLGRRLVTLELSARRALLEPSVEDASLLKLEEMHETRDPRLGRIEDLLTAGDFVEENVASAMNANLAFYKGLADGGADLDTTGGNDMIADVWAQEDDVRTETTQWLMQMLVLAYAPLDDTDIDRYAAFIASPAGKALNRALFDAYGAVFDDLSYRLGREAARILTGQDI